jgi:NAD(P)-dependent dehydrogenase (short-subunit alcohol dehydrogenase family)
MNKASPKVACITGANSGIGLELTKRLLAEGWHIIALNRSPFPDHELSIQQAIRHNRLQLYRVDLRDFGQLKAVLRRIIADVEAVDVLFNNAGISLANSDVSKQGREAHYEVNTVVPYIVLMELKPLLLRGATKTVINTSSNASLMVKSLDPETLGQVRDFRKLLGPYASSKLALSLWSQQVAPALATEEIQIRSVCPGPNKTPMTKSSGMPAFMTPLVHLFFSPPSKGAATLYEAAFHRQQTDNGAFLVKGKPVQVPFAHHAEEILQKTDDIYRLEFTRIQ